MNLKFTTATTALHGRTSVASRVMQVETLIVSKTDNAASLGSALMGRSAPPLRDNWWVDQG